MQQGPPAITRLISAGDLRRAVDNSRLGAGKRHTFPQFINGRLLRVACVRLWPEGVLTDSGLTFVLVTSPGPRTCQREHARSTLSASITTCVVEAASARLRTVTCTGFHGYCRDICAVTLCVASCVILQSGANSRCVTFSNFHPSIQSFPSPRSYNSSPQNLPPFMHPSVLSFAPSSLSGSLRQEVLQLQLSAKIPLKGNLTPNPLPTPPPPLNTILAPSFALPDLVARALVHAARPSSGYVRCVFCTSGTLSCPSPQKNTARSNRPCLCPKQHCRPADFSPAASLLLTSFIAPSYFHLTS